MDFDVIKKFKIKNSSNSLFQRLLVFSTTSSSLGVVEVEIFSFLEMGVSLSRPTIQHMAPAKVADPPEMAAVVPEANPAAPTL